MLADEVDEWVETGMDGGWLCVVLIKERTERSRLLTRKRREKFLFFLPIDRLTVLVYKTDDRLDWTWTGLI